MQNFILIEPFEAFYCCGLSHYEGSDVLTFKVGFTGAHKQFWLDVLPDATSDSCG